MIGICSVVLCIVDALGLKAIMYYTLYIIYQTKTTKTIVLHKHIKIRNMQKCPIYFSLTPDQPPQQPMTCNEVDVSDGGVLTMEGART